MVSTVSRQFDGLLNHIMLKECSHNPCASFVVSSVRPTHCQKPTPFSDAKGEDTVVNFVLVP